MSDRRFKARSQPYIAIAWLMLLLCCVQCTTYTHRVRVARTQFEKGEYEASIAALAPHAEKDGRDQLLYLVDLGSVYFTAGKYADAIRVLQKADKLAEIKDYTSITTEAATVLLNDEVKSYKGEDFEKILINVYLALSYTFLGRWDSALVECRRVNHKLDLMIRKGKLPYERNAFAKYLAGMLFEARREYNDAFVDYRLLFKWNPKLPYLGAPLLRMASVLRASQELARYRKSFPQLKNYAIGKNQGEIILIFEQGKAPEKVPTPGSRLLPMFSARYSKYQAVDLKVGQSLSARSQVLFDIEKTAIDQLEKKKAAMLAKKVGGIVVKELVAKQVAKSSDSELLGFLTSVFLHATDRADLRSWTTLPATLQVARLTVPVGTHEVILDLHDKYGNVKKNVKQWKAIKVLRGKKVFLSYRNLD